MPKTGKNGVVTYNAESRSDYLSFISEFPSVGSPQIGGVYTQTYLFTKNPNFKKMPLSRKWFYTFQPIDLCFHVSQKKKMWTGISITNLPVSVRVQIIKHLKKTQADAFSERKTRLKFRQLMMLMRLFRKLGIAIRKYSMRRGTELRAVPPDEIDNLIQFVANFTYRGSYSAVTARYKSYRPTVK